MNAKQKIRQTKLSQWAGLFQKQASSGLTVKAWCAENNISIHTYNYWKHQLKQEYVDSVLPDIIPLTDCLTGPASDLPTPSNPQMLSANGLSCDSRDLPNANNTVCISTIDIQVSISPSASEERLFRILKAVRYA